jgi:hypothetical protein
VAALQNTAHILFYQLSVCVMYYELVIYIELSIIMFGLIFGPDLAQYH